MLLRRSAPVIFVNKTPCSVCMSVSINCCCEPAPLLVRFQFIPQAASPFLFPVCAKMLNFEHELKVLCIGYVNTFKYSVAQEGDKMPCYILMTFKRDPRKVDTQFGP